MIIARRNKGKRMQVTTTKPLFIKIEKLDLKERDYCYINANRIVEISDGTVYYQNNKNKISTAMLEDGEEKKLNIEA